MWTCKLFLYIVSCIDPPTDLLSKIQSCLVDIFWDKLHWEPKSVLNLPKEGLGPVHLQSRTAAFRIQFIQRLLTDSENSNWKKVAFSVLRGFEGQFPVFYQNIFKVWAVFKIPEERTVNSLLLHEPLMFGSRLASSSELSYFVTEEDLLNSGLLTTGQVLQVAGANIIDVSSVTEKLGMRSTRLVPRALDKWKTALSEKELKLLSDYSLGFINPYCTDSFPDLYLTPIMDNCGGGCFLEVNSLVVMGSDVTSGKVCYEICVKIFNKKALDKKKRYNLV